MWYRTTVGDHVIIFIRFHYCVSVFVSLVLNIVVKQSTRCWWL